MHVMASCGAGFVAAAMGTPADVIKTRVMNQPLDDRGRYVPCFICCFLLKQIKHVLGVCYTRPQSTA